MLRETLLGMSRSDAVQKMITGLPATDQLVRGFVCGEGPDDAVLAARRLVGQGLRATLTELCSPTTSAEQADQRTQAYVDLLDRLRREKLAGSTEVSITPDAIGRGQAGQLRTVEAQTLENARVICIAARTAAGLVTVEPGDHRSTEATLALAAKLRKDYPDTGVVVSSALRRSESDCRDLAATGCRVTLVKGADPAGDPAGYPQRSEIDKSYVRCLKILINGTGRPMISTGDRRLIKIAETLALQAGRAPGDLEFQFPYGIGQAEQRRLLAAGHTVRVRLPYGPDRYGYLVGLLTEHPVNLAELARGIARR
ncbi:proline dehydrogenase [Microlunatus endophyticus]|uniref:Proline dehydrogenase n=1 Tax=Microlunatus endophyticus TaxID=1716077 RepID=A0A917W3D4_9ACTN|nr:proline dehydrogenase family protein [Microlunatus endophyticus]GGL58973.1 proline dehydrogenase [Microlunatus endophyticus]